MFYLKTLGRLSLHESSSDRTAVLSNSKPLALLAVLAVMPGHASSREYIADLFWPELDHQRARRALRQALFQLSKRSSDQLVNADDSILTVSADVLAVDLWAFDKAIEVGDYARAVDLCAGLFMAGYERKAGSELGRWIEAQNERIRAGLEIGYAQVIMNALEAEDTERAIGYAQQYVDRNPLDELAQTTLIRTLKVSGNEVQALQAYQAYRTILRDELQDEPPEQLEKSMAVVRDAMLSSPDQDFLETRLRELLARGRISLGTADSSGSRESTLRRVLGNVAIGAASGAVVFAGAVLAWSLWLAPARLEIGLNGLSGRVPVVLSRGRGSVLAEVVIAGNDVRLRQSDHAEFSLLSPDGSNLTGLESASDGMNVVIKNLETDETTRVTDEAHDEYPVQWSPDGRYLLYTYGRLFEGQTDYAYRFGIYDQETGERRKLPDVQAPWQGYLAVWSPDGTRIALVGEYNGQNGVHMVDFDGRNLRLVSPESDWAMGPAWSPGGRFLAFALEQAGDTNVFVVQPDGSELDQVTTGTYNALPYWLSDMTIAFVSNRGGADDLWAVDIGSGRMRQLTSTGTLHATRPQYSTHGSSWVESVRISPKEAVVTPGQVIEMGVQVRSADGDSLAARNLPITWTVSDESVATLDADGRLCIVGQGTAKIVASAGGWRSDTLGITSWPLVENVLEPVFVEDWRGGLSSPRWMLFGDPLPFTRPTGGPEGGGIFLNNGDNHHASGIVSRESFPIGDGLTIEVWGRMLFTGNYWEDFNVEVYADQPPRDSMDWKDQAEPALRFQVEGHEREARLYDPVFTLMGFPEEADTWRLYTLQIDPDGTVSVLIDRQLHWRTSWRIDVDQFSQVYLGLGGLMFDTEIMHGTMRVYLGSKYLLPDENRLLQDPSDK